MTTICADARVGLMAADSRVSWGNIPSVTRKIHRIGNTLIGTAGSDENGRIFADWYAKGAKRNDEPTFDVGENGEEDFEALILDKSGLFWCSSKCVLVPVENIWAIGSGMQVALALLRSGRSPSEAVEAAITVDMGSGPPVVEERL